LVCLVSWWLPMALTYREALERLFALRRFGVRPSLDGISGALDALGHPEREFSVVHVGGTNGKGSTAALCASLLGAANCRTGLYTSPHLLRFTERIRIDGVEVSEEEVADGVELVFGLGLELTFFEVATALAFELFRRRRVEVAVVEVGLGGRWDSTNVVTPLTSVVTGVALDHMEVLGGTLAAIAYEKAGIFKSGVPAVAACHDQSARAVLEAEAARVGAPLELLGRDFHPYEGALGLLGAHQRDNAALALAAIARCPEKFHAAPEAQARALAETRWPGRLERLLPDLYVDGAHNPDGAAALARALTLFTDRSVNYVVGVVDDKDAAGIVAPLVPSAARMFFTRPPSPRALDPARLLALAPAAEVVESPEEAVRRARAAGGVTVVCGSLFLVGEVRRFILGERADPLAAQDPAARKA
jgi:dihydrofolate synthase / folylpolyglutamate synthase